MARTNFYYSTTDATGWTNSAGGAIDAAEIEFIAAGIHLKATKTGYTVRSPSQSASGWGRIYRVDVEVREEVDVDSLYTHRFLVSFDGGTTYKGPIVNGRLQTVAIANIATQGFTAKQLADWRAWPLAADVSSVRVAVRPARTIPTTNEAEGYVVRLGFVHGEDVEWAEPEPDDYDALPYGDTAGHYLGPEPDYPIECEFVQPRSDFVSLSGHSQGIRRTSFVRRIYNVRFSGRDETEIAALDTFLLAHRDASFLWTPPGFTEPRAFVASDFDRDFRFVGSAGKQVGGFSGRWIEVPIPEFDYRLNPSGYQVLGAGTTRAYATIAVSNNQVWGLPWLVPSGGATLEEVKIRVTSASSAGTGAYGAVYSSDGIGDPAPNELIAAFGAVAYSGMTPPAVHFATDSTGVKTVSGLSVSLPAGEVVWFCFRFTGSTTVVGLDNQAAWPIFGWQDGSGQTSDHFAVRDTGVSLSDPVFGDNWPTVPPSISTLNGAPAVAIKYSPPIPV